MPTQPDRSAPEPRALDTFAHKRCLCCGGNAYTGTYLGKPCCEHCYRSGDLLRCLDANGNWQLAAASARDAARGDV